MSGVFQNIDPPTPSPPPGECVPLAFGAGGGHTRWVESNILEDARHRSVLYIPKYFVAQNVPFRLEKLQRSAPKAFPVKAGEIVSVFLIYFWGERFAMCDGKRWRAVTSKCIRWLQSNKNFPLFPIIIILDSRLR
jgi:hypothetical protein